MPWRYGGRNNVTVNARARLTHCQGGRWIGNIHIVDASGHWWIVWSIGSATATSYSVTVSVSGTVCEAIRTPEGSIDAVTAGTNEPVSLQLPAVAHARVA